MLVTFLKEKYYHYSTLYFSINPSGIWLHCSYENAPQLIDRRQYEYYTEDVRPKSKD
ncbi:hypothetical protein TUM17577_48940 [Enterobacter asburiae]|nr:hypothetical protein TUM17577_48940 [Enterobacter asburiae]